MTATLRVAICADFHEERWPSMDRVADALAASLARDHQPAVAATLVRPAFRRRVSRILRSASAYNIDRGVNRLVDYPRYLRSIRSQFDVVHIVDHSYAQLAHVVPPGRAVVTCHDLDTFRSVFTPSEEPRALPFRAMMQHILAGLRRAACITCDTAAVRDELVGRGFATVERTAVVPVGVSDAFTCAADTFACAADGFTRAAHTLDTARAARAMEAPEGALILLHVGSTIPRKRIDLLLQAFARIRQEIPAAHLVRVGGPFTPEQARLAAEIGVASHVCVLPAVDDRLLAAVYRRASLTLLPSDREGFGLPAIESMACGTPVLLSGLPVLREVGGPAAAYCHEQDPAAWARMAVALLREREQHPDRWLQRRHAAVEWSRRYTWQGFAARMATVYADVAGGRYERADERSTCAA